ncbi:hypothetical protein AVEN_241523-1 [Araneus ventricosus]|uniref:Uncharacterized protein n=1 Tax=Araneus ventricosus TaxID=182803 RepID=A0A4Y2KY98_ARAVE|nr:hypothetical protein AVEN_241523-1 [Araneus ventricosus]
MLYTKTTTSRHIPVPREEIAPAQFGMHTFALPGHPGNLNDSHCNSSSIEAGALVAITSHGPIPAVEVHTITGGMIHLPISIPPGEARPRLHIRRPLNHELDPPPGNCIPV